MTIVGKATAIDVLDKELNQAIETLEDGLKWNMTVSDKETWDNLDPMFKESLLVAMGRNVAGELEEAYKLIKEAEKDAKELEDERGFFEKQNREFETKYHDALDDRDDILKHVNDPILLEALTAYKVRLIDLSHQALLEVEDEEDKFYQESKNKALIRNIEFLENYLESLK